MRYAHQVPEVRAAERALMDRLPEGALMQRAAAGLAALCGRLLPRVYGSRVVVLAGGGDNGGDALLAGGRLAARGAQVTALPAGTRVHEGAMAALRAAGGQAGTDESVLEPADLVIDGLVGIGGRGGLREPHARLAARTNESAATVVAVDVPSGVDAGTGEVAGTAVRADVTVTFGTHKPGLLIDPGSSHAGVVELVDIGLGPYLPEPDVVALRSDDVAAALPRATAESDKYRRGVVGVLAGSETFTGAAVLTVGGAVHGGAGMVRFAAERPVVEFVRRRWPEAVTTVIEPDGAEDWLPAVGRVQAWVAGPGIGTGDRARERLTAVLAGNLPVLVDADGLTVLARHRELLRRAGGATVLTPHAGELARLLGVERAAVEARRLEHVRLAAAELGVTVLLKGSTTLIAETGRAVRANPTGTARLATAGTGDVLSGLIGALLAGGMAAMEAAAAGAYLHGLAARSAAPGDAAAGSAPISASDVIEALPAAYGAAR